MSESGTDGERSARTEINMRKVLIPALVGGALILLFWLLTPLIVRLLFADISERGQFGDLFGSVNALFSGLAFAVLILAIYLQGQELALQRQELGLQRVQMTAQAEAQDALFRATVGQIRVAAEQARIEALNMLAQEATHTQRRNLVAKIEGISEIMDRIANTAETVEEGDDNGD